MAGQNTDDERTTMDPRAPVGASAEPSPPVTGPASGRRNRRREARTAFDPHAADAMAEAERGARRKQGVLSSAPAGVSPADASPADTASREADLADTAPREANPADVASREADPVDAAPPEAMAAPTLRRSRSRRAARTAFDPDTSQKVSAASSQQGSAAPQVTHAPQAPLAPDAAPAAATPPGRSRRQARTEFDPNAADSVAALERSQTISAPQAAHTARPVPHTGTVPAGSALPATAPTDATGPALHEGITVQQYELIRELGRGGMGQVFLARDTKLGRKVAIKFLFKASPNITERFLVEARATAQFNHENIVTIYEVNEYQGLPFMVLEYLEGRSLAELLDGKRFPPTRAVDLILPVVRALENAHAAGIIHRDLKPENIYVCNSGAIKVLDFGIAKLLSENGRQDAAAAASPGALASSPSSAQESDGGSAATQPEGIAGTVTYMAPEQWGGDQVDHRVDIWAIGLILYELLAGENPLERLTLPQLMGVAAKLDQPMPSVSAAVRGLPADLERLVDTCLAKHKELRFETAAALREQLELAAPTPQGQRVSAEESPYPGLTAFQERDASKFFGRDADIQRLANQLRSAPMAVVVGPSGVGKSSFVRAGVVPVLKASGEPWETYITRPGRAPLEGLADLLAPMTQSQTGEPSQQTQEHEVQRLRSQPGYLGSVLRARARDTGRKVLLFVDQFEELFTQSLPPQTTADFLSALLGLADDANSPVRLVLSMRSDFLDRAAEDRTFGAELARSLFFLQPPTREGLAEAITKPAAMAGHHFEDEHMVQAMLDELQDTPGALPLLQFSAAKLWDTRDRDRKLLTHAGYDAMGGVAGALASHADEVLEGFSSGDQKLVRALFQRLVSAERTRVITEVADLAPLGSNPDQVEAIVRRLVEARLLVVHQRGEDEGTAVEIVHESLVHRWPTLKRWLDENQEDSAFLDQLRHTAKQWVARGNPQGLLWRGEAMQEARRFHRRYRGDLSPLEREYLDAVIALANRSTRVRRALVVGAFVFLIALIAVGTVVLFRIRNAEQQASHQANVAQAEAERARRAEKKIKRQLELIRKKDQLVVKGKKELKKTATKLQKSETSLNMTYKQLQAALKKSRAAQARAEEATRQARLAAAKSREAAAKAKKAAKAEREAKKRTEQLLAKQKARLRRLLKKRRTIATDLK